MIRSPETRQNPSTVVSQRKSLLQERLNRQHGSNIPKDRDRVPESFNILTHAQHKLVAQINTTPTACASDDHIAVEEHKVQLEHALAEFV